MAKSGSTFCAVALAFCVLAVSAPTSAGPYVVGNRSFAATPTTDDPFVADEMALTTSHTRQGSTASSPTVRETEFDAEIDKRVTKDFGLAFAGGYKIVDPVGAPNNYGFTNFTGTAKYQFVRSDAHEFISSFGVIREFGGTGAAGVGADHVGATTPTLYAGKGLGELPQSLAFLRPIAITGTFGYQFADRRSLDKPDFIVVGGSIQYSLRYLEGNVHYLGLPEFIDRLTPLVEIAYTTPASRASGISTAGTIAPGIIYGGNHFDLGIEALIPTTAQAGTNVGFVATFRWRFDGMLSAVFGGDES